MTTILMTGATGLIGNTLGQKLFRLGYSIKVVTRNKKNALKNLSFPAEVISCDLNTTQLMESAFENVSAVIHLAGETIDGHWTVEKKKNILDSRVFSTQNLLKNIPPHIKTILSASAQGIYGNQGDLELKETAEVGSGFLADVCKQWEQPLLELSKNSSVRICRLRLGVVLSHKGGALKKMLPLFQNSLGAKLGNGNQWMSWIHIDDLCQIFTDAISNLAFQGEINVSTSHPIQNKEFTKIMCQQLKVWQAPAVPKIALSLVLGEMSVIVLDSIRMIPEKLVKLGFQFKYPNLESALAKELQEFAGGKGFYTVEQYLPYPIEDVFNFFADEKNLQRITPDSLHFNIKSMSTASIQKNTLINYSLKIHGIPVTWQTQIESWNPPTQFIDNQLKGPYKKWHHTHQFEKLGEGTLMSDAVRYELPLGFLGRIVAGAFVQGDIETIFAYRRQIIAENNF
ncbi:MAG: TIGR01777 family oxidoreductase [Pseudobdellovibrio sp.]